MKSLFACLCIMILGAFSSIPHNRYVGPSYCRPTYTEGCTYNDGIDSFVFNNNSLSNNSGCSEGGYGFFNAKIPTVSPGSSYSFSVKFIANYLPTGVSVWADLNQNGIFESTERLYNGNDLFDQFTGTMTIPSSTLPGQLNVRISTISYSAPNDPCGTYDYGETEDYQFQVLSANQEISSIQNGFWNQSNTWSCTCIPALANTVYIKHIVRVPANYVAKASKVKFSANARLNFSSNAKLQYK